MPKSRCKKRLPGAISRRAQRPNRPAHRAAGSDVEPDRARLFGTRRGPDADRRAWIACRRVVGFMGCHGALNGLRVARAFAAANPNACVLLSAVKFRLHHQYHWQPDQIVANALFADGAAAWSLAAQQDLCRGSRSRRSRWS